MNNFEIKIGAIVVKNNQVLLIKEKNTGNNQYYWNLIKGTFEEDKDNGLLDAVKRECREEANIDIKIEKLINIIYYRKKDKIRLQINFLCFMDSVNPYISDQAEQVARNEDITTIKLFTRDELAEIKQEEFMNERTYTTVKDYLNNKTSDISTLKEIIKL